MSAGELHQSMLLSIREFSDSLSVPLKAQSQRVLRVVSAVKHSTASHQFFPRSKQKVREQFSRQSAGHSLCLSLTLTLSGNLCVCLIDHYAWDFALFLCVCIPITVGQFSTFHSLTRHPKSLTSLPVAEKAVDRFDSQS